MKVRVPVIIKDPEVADYKDLPFWEMLTVEEDVFLDGPISRRVAVIDLDDSGRLAVGTNFVPPGVGDPAGRYAVEFSESDERAFASPDFIRAAVFGGVYKTLSLFEESDTLGRPVRWAFDGPQLLVVPRAGEWANAFYERESRSLQFFYVTGADGKRTYAAHSQDIIGHETAHAIIDGVAPDLYDAVTPESLALHEGLADVTTVLLAFHSPKLAARVLEQTGADIRRSSAFTRVAEQFATAMSAGERGFLRDLDNDYALTSPEIDRTEPHSLSQVLSGAIYRVTVQLYEELRRGATAVVPHPLVEKAEVAQYETSAREGPLQALDSRTQNGAAPGKALYLASKRMKRLIFRALDYLPPGDASFADFGRAVLAADEASHPDSSSQRDWLVQEFVARGIVGSETELKTPVNFDEPHVRRTDPAELLQSDWLAYEFVSRNRKWLGIPPRIPFEVRRRLDVCKKYFHRDAEARLVRELIVKVSWAEVEPLLGSPDLAASKRVRRGLTLAIDWETRKVRALLHLRPDAAQSAQRDAFIAALYQRELLALGDAARAAHGRPLRSVIAADLIDDVLRVRSAARLLHIVGGY